VFTTTTETALTPFNFGHAVLYLTGDVLFYN